MPSPVWREQRSEDGPSGGTVQTVLRSVQGGGAVRPAVRPGRRRCASVPHPAEGSPSKVIKIRLSAQFSGEQNVC